MFRFLGAFLLAAFVAISHGDEYEDMELTCGSGEVIDMEPEEYLWNSFSWTSPGFLDGEEYPANTE